MTDTERLQALAEALQAVTEAHQATLRAAAAVEAQRDELAALVETKRPAGT